MKIQAVKDFLKKDIVSLLISLIGPLFMGTFHLVFVILRFDWILLNYCIFSYLFALFLVWQWSIERFHLKPHPYVAALISMFIILAPMMAAIVLTILFKDAPHYLFDWFIYAYATYGTIKMVLAIRNLCKKEKTERQYVLSFFGLLSALYTIQMMEFNLIITFGDIKDNSMYMMMLFTQGFIFLFALFLIGLFIYKTIKLKKNIDE